MIGGNPFDSLLTFFLGFFLFLPFALWKWVEIFHNAILWFQSHWM